ncbi:MAG TPA: NAD(P)/FAD-dependent oxidoreductase [Clostridia bacterium]|nr:NAD(P)/FAD-dependent oxidoreductase [Clostridia bacterium]
MVKKVLVVGGGPAGMMAAIQAKLLGADVFILEKNNVLGKKLLLTGGGRCNLTNMADLNKFISNIPGNGKFLFSCFTRFFNKELVDFFETIGVELREEREGRVFPASGKAADVVKGLEKYLKKIGVVVRYQNRVKNIIAENNVIKGVVLDDGSLIKGDAVILATGGVSYPHTGSTGDGLRIAAQLGHTISPIYPSLVPLEVEEYWVKELQGLTLPSVGIGLKIDNKIKKQLLGEVLFTHFGLSGPKILIMSREVAFYLAEGRKMKIELNLKPGKSAEEINKEMQSVFAFNPRKILKNSLETFLPPKLIPIFIQEAKVASDKLANQITKEERLKLVQLMQHFKFSISATRPIEEATITRGGVSVKDIDPHTMSSKLIKNLFFAGELIDVDGLTGGFNLQIAFSTGYLAGFSAANNNLI